MSKMSQLHAELTQEAYGLGFDSLEDALNHGYVPEYEGGKLVPTEEIIKQAHEAWLKEKEVILGDLKNLYLGYCTAGKSDTTEADVVRRAIEFVQKGEQ